MVAATGLRAVDPDKPGNVIHFELHRFIGGERDVVRGVACEPTTGRLGRTLHAARAARSFVARSSGTTRGRPHVILAPRSSAGTRAPTGAPSGERFAARTARAVFRRGVERARREERDDFRGTGVPRRSSSRSRGLPASYAHESASLEIALPCSFTLILPVLPSDDHCRAVYETSLPRCGIVCNPLTPLAVHRFLADHTGVR